MRYLKDRLSWARHGVNLTIKVTELGLVWLLLVSAFIMRPSILWAGPPYQTDDPEPTELGRLEVFVAAATTCTLAGSQWALPQLQLNYGAAPDVQLSYSGQLSISAPTDAPVTAGLGDTSLSVKYRFLHESDSLPQAAVFPQVVLPSGDAGRGLGAGQAQYLLPLWLQKSWGPWTAFGGGGYWINRVVGGKDWTFLGAALQRVLGEKLSLGAEVIYHSSAQEGAADGTGAGLAVLWHFDKDQSIVLSGGRDLIGGSVTFNGFAAYQWII